MADFDAEDCLRRYHLLMESSPDLFRRRPEGGIQIVTEPDLMRQAQEAAGKAYREAGIGGEDLRIGVLTEWPFASYVRDAVRFPDGQLGLYLRILATNGVTLLPILDGKIVLERIFRHPTGAWFLEAPRGGLEAGMTYEEMARHEVREEIGAELLSYHDLGLVHTTSGISPEWIRLAAGHIGPPGEPGRAEGISGTRIVTVEEMEAMILDGRITDASTIVAFTRARLAGLV